jgi:hypothetical protein
MNTNKNNIPKFVVCIKNEACQASLELYKIYRVISDEDAMFDGDLRIIDESGEDYFFPANYFVPIKVPQDVKKAMLPEQ